MHSSFKRQRKIHCGVITSVIKRLTSKFHSKLGGGNQKKQKCDGLANLVLPEKNLTLQPLIDLDSAQGYSLNS